jgi:hypothetical protein
VAFENIVRDPPVFVSGRVNEVEQFWQKNRCDVCPAGIETTVNLQGLDPGNIRYDPNRIVPLLYFPFNLTGVSGIGHTEVHDEYQSLIDSQLPPGAPPGGGAAPAPPRGMPGLFQSGQVNFTVQHVLSGVTTSPKGNALLQKGRPVAANGGVDHLFAPATEEESRLALSRRDHDRSAEDVFDEAAFAVL